MQVIRLSFFRVIDTIFSTNTTENYDAAQKDGYKDIATIAA